MCRGRCTRAHWTVTHGEKRQKDRERRRIGARVYDDYTERCANVYVNKHIWKHMCICYIFLHPPSQKHHHHRLSNPDVNDYWPSFCCIKKKKAAPALCLPITCSLHVTNFSRLQHESRWLVDVNIIHILYEWNEFFFFFGRILRNFMGFSDTPCGCLITNK